MIMIDSEGRTATVALCTKSALYTAHQFGLAVQSETGAIELHPVFCVGLAQGYADALNGRVLRTWHDHSAGIVMAEIELSGVEA
jgi:hypothetical protein